MLKPDRLRAALVAAVPDYGRDPDRLAIFIDQGRIASRFCPPSYNFEYRYRLRATLLDFTGHPDVVMLALLQWLTVQQPELLLNHGTGNESIAFEADILDAGKIDLDITLQLTEAVVLRPRQGGGHDLVHLDEPSIDDALDGVPAGTALTDIWIGDDQILPAPFADLP